MAEVAALMVLRALRQAAAVALDFLEQGHRPQIKLPVWQAQMVAGQAQLMATPPSATLTLVAAAVGLARTEVAPQQQAVKELMPSLAALAAVLVQDGIMALHRLTEPQAAART
jgi:hypothetical protein